MRGQALITRTYAIAAAASVAGLFYLRALRTPQVNEVVSGHRLADLSAFCAGQSRWGLLDGPLQITQCPLGADYLLLPFACRGWDVSRVTIGAFTLSLAFMLYVVLMRSRPVWWAAIIAYGVALAWQPGVVAWAGNVQHSWALTTVCVLVGVAAL